MECYTIFRYLFINCRKKTGPGDLVLVDPYGRQRNLIPVMFRTISVILRTIPVLFRTSLDIFKTPKDKNYKMDRRTKKDQKGPKGTQSYSYMFVLCFFSSFFIRFCFSLYLFYCLLFYCPQSIIYYIIFYVYCLLYTVYCLLFTIYCLLTIVNF